MTAIPERHRWDSRTVPNPDKRGSFAEGWTDIRRVYRMGVAGFALLLCAVMSVILVIGLVAGRLRVADGLILLFFLVFGAGWAATLNRRDR